MYIISLEVPFWRLCTPWYFVSCCSDAGTVLSDLEVDVLDDLGSGLKFLLGSPQLVPEVSPRWPQECSFESVGWTVL